MPMTTMFIVSLLGSDSSQPLFCRSSKVTGAVQLADALVSEDASQEAAGVCSVNRLALGASPESQDPKSKIPVTIVERAPPPGRRPTMARRIWPDLASGDLHYSGTAPHSVSAPRHRAVELASK